MKSALKGERINICVLGRMNVGKSTIINKLFEQGVSIVSDQPGTTTDPVQKRYEMIPIGPVTIYDTAGYDDETKLGKERIKSTLKVISKSDLAIIVLDQKGLLDVDLSYIKKLEKLKIGYIIVCNKLDLGKANKKTTEFICQKQNLICFSNKEKNGNILKSEIIEHFKNQKIDNNFIVKDLIKSNDVVVLVMPQDSAAPKGRIILPQMQVIREILDQKAIGVCCTDTELKKTLSKLSNPPKLVITDSQALDRVMKIVPMEVNLTTFSTLFARYKGDIKALLDGIKAFRKIKKTDKILIVEACSHHNTDQDIGSVLIPRMLKKYLGYEPLIATTSGDGFPNDIDKYKLVIHCGGCMITRTEMTRRIKEYQNRSMYVTNYGLIISEMNGQLDRMLRVLKGKLS
ncbi:MAG: [FeFe] hydrogenase H-cluster maturation GTPase HydF [Candidatus Cloacimonetes bacterium]|nr:[FeFe] hydrogenase H-cluster maturation GTPase HydF [Candidatus Cloacimonadota bacterium]